jgi:hypothetical protein
VAEVHGCEGDERGGRVAGRGEEAGDPGAGGGASYPKWRKVEALSASTISCVESPEQRKSSSRSSDENVAILTRSGADSAQLSRRRVRSDAAVLLGGSMLELEDRLQGSQGAEAICASFASRSSTSAGQVSRLARTKQLVLISQHSVQQSSRDFLSDRDVRTLSAGEEQLPEPSEAVVRGEETASPGTGRGLSALAFQGSVATVDVASLLIATRAGELRGDRGCAPPKSTSSTRSCVCPASDSTSCCFAPLYPPAMWSSESCERDRKSVSTSAGDHNHASGPCRRKVLTWSRIRFGAASATLSICARSVMVISALTR